MKTTVLATTVAFGLALAPAYAQTAPAPTTSAPAPATTGTLPPQTGLVNVNLSNIRVEIARNMKVDLEKVPINLQLPINVAANICGLDVNLLSKQSSTSQPSCTATNSSLAMQYVTNTVQ
jgi:hypothetical protein